MPAVPSCLLEPIWAEFRVLLGAERPPFDLTCDTTVAQKACGSVTCGFSACSDQVCALIGGRRVARCRMCGR